MSVGKPQIAHYMYFFLPETIFLKMLKRIYRVYFLFIRRCLIKTTKTIILVNSIGYR